MWKQEGSYTVLNKDKKIFISAINTAAEAPVSKTVFKQFFLQYKSLPRCYPDLFMALLNADTNEYEKLFNKPFCQGYTAEQIISSCSSMKHWHETSVQAGNLLQLTPRLFQLIFLFQTFQIGFIKDFVQILSGFIESQLNKCAQSTHLKDLGKVTFASCKILFHTP